MVAVSIILPVYNVEKYITDCINSIKNQTFKNFEIIIIDDETKDKSIEIAEKLLKNTDIDYTVVHRKNGGLAAARNSGLKVAKGEYLVFVDSDDIINPQYLETLYNDIIRNSAVMAITKRRDVTDETKYNFDLSDINGEVVDKKEFLYKVLRHKIVPYFGCFMINRQFILENKLWFDESVFFGVDQAYRWKLMVKAEKYTYNPKETYNYIVRPGSIMTSSNLKKMITGIKSLEGVSKELEDNEYINSSWIAVQWKVSALHTIAKRFDYKTFKKSLVWFKPSIKECMTFPDIKIKLVSLLMILGSHVMYWAFQKI